MYHDNILQVYRRLNVLNVCMSHSSVLRLVEQLGEGHDAAIKKWGDQLKLQLKVPESKQVHTQTNLWVATVPCCNPPG